MKPNKPTQEEKERARFMELDERAELERDTWRKPQETSEDYADRLRRMLVSERRSHVLPRPTVGEQTEPECNQLLEWLRERRENCLLIAEGKTGDDLRGWIEDASYFGKAIRIVSASPTPIPVGEQAPKINAKNLERIVADKLFAVLDELVAQVRGECPSLLNEDSGGDGDLSIEIDEALDVYRKDLSHV